MELIDNGVIALLAGRDGRRTGRIALLLVARWRSHSPSPSSITTPVNKWTIGRGKGHAVVHQYHH